MDIKHEIGRAKNAVSTGDYSTAQKILKKVIAQDPKNVEAWLALADVVQNPEHAVKCYQRVLKFDPGNQIAGQNLISYQQTPAGPDSKRIFTDPGAQALENRLQQVARPGNPWKVETSHTTITSDGNGDFLPTQKPKKRTAEKKSSKNQEIGPLVGDFPDCSPGHVRGNCLWSGCLNPKE
jgi:tetratricopeptide (TPR) repeat protein